MYVAVISAPTPIRIIKCDVILDFRVLEVLRNARADLLFLHWRERREKKNYRLLLPSGPFISAAESVNNRLLAHTHTVILQYYCSLCIYKATTLLLLCNI